MLESIGDERRDPDRGRGVQHISEIVPLVLAKIGAAEAQPAIKSHTRVKPSPAPGVLADFETMPRPICRGCASEFRNSAGICLKS